VLFGKPGFDIHRRRLSAVLLSLFLCFITTLYFQADFWRSTYQLSPFALGALVLMEVGCIIVMPLGYVFGWFIGSLLETTSEGMRSS
jgi:hypothetical protein